MNIIMAKTFLEVVKAGNLNRAADHLNVTQSTVTTRINALEDRLGQSLIVRNKSGTELTAAGFKFKRYAEILVQIWQQAQQDVSLPSNFSSTLTIGFEHNMWDSTVKGWLTWLQENEPNIALATWAGDKATLGRWLSSGLIDVAVSFEAPLKEAKNAEKLYEDRLICASTSADCTSTSYVFVDWGEEFRRAHALAYPNAQSAALLFGDGSFALSYILENEGSGYFPTKAIQKHLGTKKLVAIESAPVFSISVFLSLGEGATRNNWILDSLRKIN